MLNNSYRYQQYYNNYYKNINKSNNAFSKNYNNFQSPTPNVIDLPIAKDYQNNNYKENKKEFSTDYIDILDVKLKFDDILLVLLLYFLYLENVKDTYLYFILILLLLN